MINLNLAQQEAVTSPHNNILVLAGAGSGKTRVLTERIGWLLQQGIGLASIMAVTFTNKAASEMRHRVEKKLGVSLQSMWLGTFHGLAHRFLRLHWHEAGLEQNFQIIDSDDQLRLIKRIHKDLNLSEEQWQPKQSQHYINRNKDAGLRPKQIHAHDYASKMLLQIYETYSLACKKANLVDFSELLLRAYEVLQEQPSLLEHYKQRFQHVLIDEFQDTNSLQYAWVKLLTQNSACLLVVGDDDQSIYSWRGADVENMRNLKHDFPNLHTIRLEQNYRSTSNILQVANAVIANNSNRLGKNLWTDGNAGELVSIYGAYNELEEAKYIVNKIIAFKKELYTQTNLSLETNAQGLKLSDIAILYRSNAQSRLFEEQLINYGIQYRIYGGLRFFERAEIKDVLAYLRLVVNCHDDGALERIINVPTRGIGETTLISVREYAKHNQVSLFTSIEEMLMQKILNSRAVSALGSFYDLINTIRSKINTLTLAELTDYVIKSSGLYDYFAKDKSEKKAMRLDNLEELVHATQQFMIDNHEENNTLNLLTSFLANASLESGEMVQAKEDNDCVQLMTLHSAKGLEFHTVFLCGLEEGLFPHAMSVNEENGLEEERRLCYVGITRARVKLYCTYAESRQWYGSSSYRKISRFLTEIPEELLCNENDNERSASYRSTKTTQNSYNTDNSYNSYSDKSYSEKNYSKNSYSSFANNANNLKKHSNNNANIANTFTQKSTVTQQSAGFNVGQRVTHAKFGEGTIMGFEGSGESLLIQIKFNKFGTKWLSPLYAKLIA